MRYEPTVVDLAVVVRIQSIKIWAYFPPGHNEGECVQKRENDCLKGSTSVLSSRSAADTYGIDGTAIDGKPAQRAGKKIDFVVFACLEHPHTHLQFLVGIAGDKSHNVPLRAKHQNEREEPESKHASPQRKGRRANVPTGAVVGLTCKTPNY